MSITSILSKEKGRNHLKDWFMTNFPNPNLQNTVPIKIPSNNTNGNYASEIGGALDYLIRFHIEKINPKSIIKNKLIAQKSIELMYENYVDYYLDQPLTIKIIMLGEVTLPSVIEFTETLDIFVNAAEEVFSNYISGLSRIDDNLIELSLFYAKAEEFYRSKKIPENLFHTDEEQIKELKKIFKLCLKNKVIINKKFDYILNPEFGNASKLVGGADADLIVNDMLIDIKTTKHFTLERKDLNQILSYYILSLIDNKETTINYIGIYYARFDYLLKIKIEDYYSKDEFQILKKEFVELILDKEKQLSTTRIPKLIGKNMNKKKV
ncbi:MAG: hypothetical protein CMD31_01160 [Flavobacteriales bacterium]|nr:hypothetical protein [Flavobacteriales bacterium]